MFEGSQRRSFVEYRDTTDWSDDHNHGTYTDRIIEISRLVHISWTRRKSQDDAGRKVGRCRWGAVKRLTCALLYGQGKSPAEIKQVLGFPEQTAYDWLDTVAERGWIALGDLPCPGQSARLTDVQWTELTATLAALPSEAGYEGY